MRRYKRFLADVELASGEVVTSHCPNPGSMKTCAPEGARVWLSRSESPRRKLPFTLELVEAEGVMVFVHPGRANDLVAEAIERGVVTELAGYPTLRREVRVGDRSRIDFLLERGDEHCYVEVKNVTLNLGAGVSAFPDSVTARGTRHLEELMKLAAAGHRAMLFFCAGRADAGVVKPADHIDPVYGETLRRALAGGVETLAYRCDISPEAVELVAPIEVEV